jgi:hypothetical protein
VTFFLLAMLHVRRLEFRAARPLRDGIVLALCSLASAWSFSRGVLTGPIVAVLVLGRSSLARDRGARRNLAAAALAPSLLTAWLIFHLSPASHHLGLSLAHIKAMASFATWYFSANPFLPLWGLPRANWGMEALGWPGVLALAAVKLALIGVGVRCADPSQRRVLFALLLLEISYALLLAYGRSEGDLHLAMSSRYQYVSLLCTLPFAGEAMVALFARTGLAPAYSALGAAVIIALGVATAVSGWPQVLPPWVEWRGLSDRRLLLQAGPPPPGYNVVGIPFLSNPTVKQLVTEFHLK